MLPADPDRRALIAGGLAWLAAPVAARAAAYEAVVVAPGARAPGGPRFATLGAAFAAAEAPRSGAFRIWLGAGVWREKLTLTAPDVWIEGEDRHGTRLRFDAASGTLDPAGKPWGTSGSGTLIVSAPGFRAKRLTIENGFDAAALGDRAPHDRQAVALMLAGASDDAVVSECDILGRQDTLFVNAGRSSFERCLVAGTVDFVFGGGRARLLGCEVRSLATGYVAAPSTARGQEVGLVFDRCHLTREVGVPDGSVFLGRAWRPTRSFADGRYGDPDAVGMAAFLDCRMEAHIAPAGWTAMSYGARDGSRVALAPQEARFFERGSSGTGAAGARVGRVLSDAAVRRLRGGW